MTDIQFRTKEYVKLYKETNIKTASNKITRMLAHIGQAFSFSDAEKWKRLELLRTAATLESQLKEIEDLVLSKGIESQLDLVQETIAMSNNMLSNLFDPLQVRLEATVNSLEKASKKSEKLVREKKLEVKKKNQEAKTIEKNRKKEIEKRVSERKSKEEQVDEELVNEELVTDDTSKEVGPEEVGPEEVGPEEVGPEEVSSEEVELEKPDSEDESKKIEDRNFLISSFKSWVLSEKKDIDLLKDDPSNRVGGGLVEASGVLAAELNSREKSFDKLNKSDAANQKLAEFFVSKKSSYINLKNIFFKGTERLADTSISEVTDKDTQEFLENSKTPSFIPDIEEDLNEDELKSEASNKLTRWMKRMKMHMFGGDTKSLRLNTVSSLKTARKTLQGLMDVLEKRKTPIWNIIDYLKYLAPSLESVYTNINRIVQNEHLKSTQRGIEKKLDGENGHVQISPARYNTDLSKATSSMKNFTKLFKKYNDLEEKMNELNDELNSLEGELVE